MGGSLPPLLGLLQLDVHDGDVVDVDVLGALEVVQAADPVDHEAGPEELGVGDELLPGVELELGVVAEGGLALDPVNHVPLVHHGVVQEAVGGLGGLLAAEVVLGAIGDALAVQPLVQQVLAPQPPLPLADVRVGGVDDVVLHGLPELFCGSGLELVGVVDVAPELLLRRPVLEEQEHRDEDRGEPVAVGELHDGGALLPVLQHLLGVLLDDVEALLDLPVDLLGEQGVQELVVVGGLEPADVLGGPQAVVELLVLLVAHRIGSRGSCTGR